MSRQLVGAILRGDVDMSALMADADKPAPEAGLPTNAALDEGLTGETGSKPVDDGAEGADKALKDAFNSKLFDSNVTSLEQLGAEGEHGDAEAGHGGEHAEEEHHEVHNIWKVPDSGKKRVFWALSFPLMVRPRRPSSSD